MTTEQEVLLVIIAAALSLLALPVVLWVLRWVTIGLLTVAISAWGWARYFRTRNRPPAVGQHWKRQWGMGSDVYVQRAVEGSGGPYTMFIVGNTPSEGPHRYGSSWSRGVPADQFRDMVRSTRMVLVDQGGA